MRAEQRRAGRRIRRTRRLLRRNPYLIGVDLAQMGTIADALIVAFATVTGRLTFLVAASAADAFTELEKATRPTEPYWRQHERRAREDRHRHNGTR